MTAGSPKTILFVVDGLGLSGKTRTLVHLASNLNRQRYQAVVCTLSTETSVLADQLRAHRVAVHVMPCRDGVDVRVILQLRRVMRLVEAEVVHCYNPRPILYGGLAARSLNLRATVGFLSAFACQVPDRVYGFLPQPLNTVSRRNVYRNRLAAHLMRRLVTVSTTLGKRFCEYNHISLDKLRVVPYGADIAALEQVDLADVARLRQQLGFSQDHVVVGSVGRLVEQKDYPTQLTAFAAAQQQVPQLRMVIAGDGPLKAPLMEHARSLGVDSHVHFLGHWERVPCLLRALDIFVLASKFEPFGVALLEAKAAGLAIIATNVNEIPEILNDGNSGLLAPAEDPQALAHLLVTLARDPGARARLGDAAAAEARNRHSLAAGVAAYQEMYDSFFPPRFDRATSAIN